MDEVAIIRQAVLFCKVWSQNHQDDWPLTFEFGGWTVRLFTSAGGNHATLHRGLDAMMVWAFGQPTSWLEILHGGITA